MLVVDDRHCLIMGNSETTFLCQETPSALNFTITCGHENGKTLLLNSLKLVHVIKGRPKVFWNGFQTAWYVFLRISKLYVWDCHHRIVQKNKVWNR